MLTAPTHPLPAEVGAKPAKLSMRAKARQNLLVAAVNVALERQLITLDCQPIEAASFEFELAGLPVRAHVDDAGFDEVRINVIVCPTERSVGTFIHYWQPKYGAATTFNWLERRTGKYLQTGVCYRGARDVTRKLSELTIVPKGFGTRPTKDGYDYFRECDRVFGMSKRITAERSDRRA